MDEVQLSNENYNQNELSNAHQMTLDEAIVHANEIAEKEECEHCAAEHKQLADWLSELKDIKNRYVYLAADFDNYKKRTLKNEKLTYDKAHEDIILRFLNVYDDMERLYDSLDIMSDESIVDVSKEHTAYSMIFENFEKTLNSLGCEKIECHKGDVFNVEYMDAISARTQKMDEHLKPNDVADIFQSGWKFKGKIIRPVKVVVVK